MTSAATQDHILDTGANLLSKVGLSGVTVGSLAELTSMSKSGLFAHFKSKDVLQIHLLERSADIAAKYVILPSMSAPEGIDRLRTLVHHWLGWGREAGLDGGCPVAAGMFELDDREGPVRDRLLQMESKWRDLLAQLVRRAIELGQLRSDLDVDQFVWELCGIYLSHHASLRFVRDRNANNRAATAFEALLARAIPACNSPQRTVSRRRKEK